MALSFKCNMTSIIWVRLRKLAYCNAWVEDEEKIICVFYLFHVLSVHPSFSLIDSIMVVHYAMEPEFGCIIQSVSNCKAVSYFNCNLYNMSRVMMIYSAVIKLEDVLIAN